MSDSELSDEEMARQLQAQFDEEYNDIKKREENDLKFARSLIGKHDMSDSDPEPPESKNAHERDTESDVTPDEEQPVQKQASRGEAGSSTTKSERTQEVPGDDSDETPDEDEIYKEVSKAKRFTEVRRTTVVSMKRVSRESTNRTFDSDDEGDSFTRNAGESSIAHVGDSRPLCKYGAKCFRKNLEHRRQFRHVDAGFKSDAAEIPSKRLKLSESVAVFSEQYGFYLTTVAGIPSRYNTNCALGLKDILSPKWGNLVASAQFNYMTDVHWLVAQYASEFRSKPLLIVHGDERDAKKALEKSAAAYSHITLCQAKLEIMFGTHHTKMMLLQYDDGMRVVIHTSNLIHGDWHQKTQGIWMSPKLPCVDEANGAAHDSASKFRRDLLEYLKAYNSLEVNKWCDVITRHNFSSVKVYLIASIPGRHKVDQKFSFGHLKLRKVLKENGPSSSSVNTKWPVIAQFSSIGSLGPNSDSWLCNEFIASQSTTRNVVLNQKFSNVQLVFPSVENVRLSLEGYPAGGSLPYSKDVAVKQKWLNAFLHHWKSDRRGRSCASPHIKTYCRPSPDLRSLAWFLVTSANLSKAAWGALEKNGTQLMIRSYEIGVLFLPQHFSNDEESKKFFPLTSGDSSSNPDAFPLPYDLPLTPYSASDQPWIWNIEHAELPDRYGNAWSPH